MSIDQEEFQARVNELAEGYRVTHDPDARPLSGHDKSVLAHLFSELYGDEKYGDALMVISALIQQADDPDAFGSLGRGS